MSDSSHVVCVICLWSNRPEVSLMCCEVNKHLCCIRVDDLESRRDVPWGELVEEAESRTPGRVVHVHEKLSSPCRKR